MFLFGLIGQGLSQSEITVATLGIVVLLCAACWLLLRWIATSPTSPNPWDERVATDLAGDGCPQVCHNCLTPHDSLAHFCPRCGVMVGACTSLMPPLYLSSIGDVFRAGLEGSCRPSTLLTGGFFFASFVAYVLVAPLFFLTPFYWYKLLKNLSASRTANAGNVPSVDSQQ